MLRLCLPRSLVEITHNWSGDGHGNSLPPLFAVWPNLLTVTDHHLGLHVLLPGLECDRRIAPDTPAGITTVSFLTTAPTGRWPEIARKHLLAVTVPVSSAVVCSRTSVHVHVVVTRLGLILVHFTFIGFELPACL